MYSTSLLCRTVDPVTSFRLRVQSGQTGIVLHGPGGLDAVGKSARLRETPSRVKGNMFMKPWVFVLPLILTSGAVIHAGGNLVVNPGFEELDPKTTLPAAWRVANWSGTEGAFEASTVCRAGRYSLKIVGLGERSNLVAMPRLSRPLEPGRTYVAQCWARAAGDAAARAYIHAVGANAERLLSVSTPYFRRQAAWTKLEFEFVFPTEKVKQWTLVLKNDGKRGVVWFDDVAVWDKADGPPAAPPVGTERVVLTEDFSAPSLDPRWTVVSGEWKWSAGALHATGPGARIVFNEGLGRNLRVEYTAWTDEPPGDLSVMLGVALPLGGKRPEDNYLFGFGSMRNSKNTINARGRALAETRPENYADGIVQGRKHSVMAENNGKRLALTIDGKPALAAEDPRASQMTGASFGFYIWNSGFVDDLRVTVLPEAAGGETRAEVEPSVAEHSGFDGQTPGQPPGGFEVTGADGARVVNEPTWVYCETLEATVDDLCVEVEAGPRPATLRHSFGAVASGIVELDLRLLSFGADGFRLALLDALGAETATLHVDRDGILKTVTAEGERPLYIQRIEIPHRFDSMDLRFEPERWHTLRLAFDASAGVFHVALINVYTELASGYRKEGVTEATHLTVETDIPFQRPAPQVAGVVFHAGAGVKARLDNLCVVGPVGTERVNGKDRMFPARELLGLGFALRKDPLDLKIYSLRNVRDRNLAGRIHSGESWAQVWLTTAPKYQSFNAYAATRYNDLLVRHAFVEERRQMLDRAAFYLEKAGSLGDKLARRMETARKSAEAAGSCLAETYRAYAEAYLDSLNEERLEREFTPAADRLEAALARAEKGIGACLDASPRTSVASSVRVPCPLPLPARFPEWKDGQYRDADGRPTFIFPLWGPLEFPRMDQSLRVTPTVLHGFGRLLRQVREGEIVDLDTLSQVTEQALCSGRSSGADPRPRKDSRRPDARLHVYLSTGGNDLLFTVPSWWAEKHAREDPDVFIWTPEGRPVPDSWRRMGYPQSSHAHLNYWNPRARDLVNRSLDITARWYKENAPGRVAFFGFGYEIGNGARGYEAGHNRSAVEAFRRFLQKEYGDLEQLNRTWGTEHDSFDAIEPPKQPVRPCGVQYEFQRFRNLGHKEWRRECIEVMRKHTPDVPMAADHHTTMGGGFDMPALMTAFDILGWHTYRPPDFKFSNRWLSNLRDVYGTALGNMEWAANMHLGTLFPETPYKNNGLRQAFHMMMWGQAVQGVWYGQATGWSPGANWTEPRLAHIVLRYSSTFLPLMIDRARRIGVPALEAPSVPPDVGILEATSSYFNGWPMAATRGGMAATARAFEKAGLNYGFFYEAPLLEGEQDLMGVQALVVPNGICMPPQLARLLGDWIEAGGILIGFAPPGVYDSYGQPAGALLDRVWPGVAWAPEGYEWRPASTNAPPVEHRPDLAPGALYRGRLGRGEVAIHAAANAFDALALAALAEVRRTVKRSFFGDGNAFDLALRRRGDRSFLYALNYDLELTRTDTIRVRGRVRSVADINLERPALVPFRSEEGHTVFDLRLAPAEGTLLELCD